jgi:hypothetical protein
MRKHKFERDQVIDIGLGMIIGLLIGLLLMLLQ